MAVDDMADDRASAPEGAPDLRGRTVLVTGATSGIGAATAVAFGRCGAHVLAGGRDRGRGEETCAAVEAAGGRATLMLADLTDHGAVVGLAREALDRTGDAVDVLVNCAGGGSFKPAEAVTPEDYEAVYGLNVRAPFFLTAIIAPAMARRGRGAIVNVASAGVGFGIPGLSLFSSAKAALNALTRNWAAEYGPAGVRVNSVDVGSIRTPVNAAHHDAVEAMVRKLPTPRMGHPEEVAATVLFLSSPAASYIQGAVLPVDGGFAVTSLMAS